MKYRRPIPVLMYHSVGRKIGDWKWSFLTVPVKIFENHLKFLSNAGYKTANLEELYEHVNDRASLPQKLLCLHSTMDI